MRTPVITFRLLLISIGMPAIFVALDQAALGYGAANRWSPATGVAISSWLVAQAALLSFIAGAKLPNWGWRLLLLGWSLVLVNLLLGVGAMENQWDQRLLALAFLSAQIGALTAWLILGIASFPIRVGLVLMAGVPVHYLSNVLDFSVTKGHWHDPWIIIVSVQTGGATSLAAILRVAGYRIEPEGTTSNETIGGPVQFSIRHLLIATTAVAIVVPVVQGLLRTSSRWMGAAQWLHASADGVVLALVSLTALWAALGSGRCWLKTLVFVLLAVIAGGGLFWLEVTARYHQGPYSFRPEPLTYAGWRWIAWTLLTGSFLAGMLLVLRASGYRLIRRRR
jgi:hypothetical protein